MTDNEIIKAFEYVVKSENNKIPITGKMLLEDTLDLINRQKAEIEKLQEELEYKCDSCQNIRLKRNEYFKAIKTAKSEAIKEFERRLKEKVWDADTRCGYVQVVDVGDIEGIAEEMAGE